MEKVKIAIIDTGISINAECAKCISESYVLSSKNGNYLLSNKETEDYIGHGTAVATIIYSICKEIEFISINIGVDSFEVEEESLIYALNFLYQNYDVDLVNISAGVTYGLKGHSMTDICDKLKKKGAIVIAAFDNNKAISYPAACNSVVGVDTVSDFSDKKSIIHVIGSIVNILVPDIYYRTLWRNERTIIKGSSFATAKITGLFAAEICSLRQGERSKYNINTLMKAICKDVINVPKKEKIIKPSFNIKNAIIFPLNKESRALLNNKEMLNFNIVGVYDSNKSMNIHKNILGEYIMSNEEINWNDEFDTIILSCTDELMHMTRRDYYSEIVEMAQKYNKNIYSFEKENPNTDKYFYPKIIKEMVPFENLSKLHKIVIPIVGVFGTSSKQGKFTLQLELIQRLKKLQYSVGYISSEPSGYLFDADFVFHFGYHSFMNLHPRQCIAILNQMVWEVQEKQKDILIVGCQSNTIHYDNCQVDDFAIYQNAFILGTLPDFVILCVNPHDDVEYVERTINYINAIDEGNVEALVVFPVLAIETVSQISYKLEKLSSADMKKYKDFLLRRFNLPTYALGEEDDMQHLCERVISFFSEN